MGTFVNKFTCIELTNDVGPVSTLLQQYVPEDIASSVHISAGSNSSVFVTIAPSGSKAGWQNYNNHEKNRDEFVDFIKQTFHGVVVKEIHTYNELD